MNLAEKMGAGLTGIEQLRAIAASGARSGIGETLQFELVLIEDGNVAFEGTPGLHAYNPIGMVHGGYAATLLDSACGCAVHTKLSATQAYTTLELKVCYLKAMTAGTGKVRAEGKVIQIGRRAAFAEARLVDMAGKLYATATSSLLIMDR
ncbi:MAG: PaaI family thioesterase [Mesorhizobium sp.]|nr:PaaI family thioesterase [Mesorhizobium sp.]